MKQVESSQPEMNPNDELEDEKYFYWPCFTKTQKSDELSMKMCKRLNNSNEDADGNGDGEEEEEEDENDDNSISKRRLPREMMAFGKKKRVSSFLIGKKARGFLIGKKSRSFLIGKKALEFPHGYTLGKRSEI
jgi:hypothetical protein